MCVRVLVCVCVSVCVCVQVREREWMRAIEDAVDQATHLQTGSCVCFGVCMSVCAHVYCSMFVN